jgi:transposase-like protein
MSIYKKATKEKRITRALIRIDRDLSECQIKEKICCPKCSSNKIFMKKKWEWCSDIKEAILISDWTCKTCKFDFDGEDLNGLN